MKNLQLFSETCKAFPRCNICLLDSDGTILRKHRYFEDLPDNDRAENNEKIIRFEYQGEIFCKFCMPLSLGSVLQIITRECEYCSADELKKCLQSLIVMMEPSVVNVRKTDDEDEESRLLRTLLYMDSAEMRMYALLLAENLKKDLSLERAVCVIETRNKVENIVKIIKEYARTKGQDICGTDGTERVILCRCLADRGNTIKGQCDDYLRDVKELIGEKCGYFPEIYVGTLVNQMEDYVFSFKAALMVEQAVKGMESLRKNTVNIYYSEEYLIEYVFNNTDKDDLSHFLGEYAERVEKHPELVGAVEALIKYNMNISNAAKNSYVHRNTLRVRAKKLWDILEISPMSDDGDRFLFMLICMYYKKGSLNN